MQYRKKDWPDRAARADLSQPEPNAGTGDCHAIYPTAACRPDPARGGAFIPAAPAAAQEYPSRPVTLMCPFRPAAASTPSRAPAGEKLRDTLKQNIVVENKPGASVCWARNAQPGRAGGYTLLLGSAGETAINPYVYKGRMLYSPERTAAPVTLVTRVPNDAGGGAVPAGVQRGRAGRARAPSPVR